MTTAAAIGSPELLRTLARVNTLLVNDEEARQLAEEHNLRKAAARILTMVIRSFSLLPE